MWRMGRQEWDDQVELTLAFWSLAFQNGLSLLKDLSHSDKPYTWQTFSVTILAHIFWMSLLLNGNIFIIMIFRINVNMKKI